MQRPVSTGAEGAPQGSADDVVGHGEASRHPGRRGGEDGAEHPAAIIDQGAAGVAAAHRAAQRGDRAADRAAAVGVLADRVAGLAEPRRSDGVGAVLRVTEHRRDSSRLWLGGERERRQIGVDVEQGEVVFGVVADGRRAQRGAIGSGDRGVVLTCDDVGVGDDQAGTGHPARALDPEPAGRAEHPHDRIAGIDHLRVFDNRGIGRGHRRRRSDDRGSRIDPVQRVEDRPRGRQHLVEAAQDQRALHVGAQLGGAGRVQRNRPEHPGQPQRHRGDQSRSARPVGEVQEALAANQPSSQVEREALQGHRHQGTRHQRPQGRAQRRVGRLRPLVEHQWAQPAADERADPEPEQRQRSDDQSLPESPEAEGQGESHDRPIQNRHRIK